ncbi:MAG: hypothetical protein ACYCSB_02165 [bacterium]
MSKKTTYPPLKSYLETAVINRLFLGKKYKKGFIAHTSQTFKLNKFYVKTEFNAAKHRIYQRYFYLRKNPKVIELSRASLFDVKTICRLVMSGQISITKKGIENFKCIIGELFKASGLDKPNYNC